MNWQQLFDMSRTLAGAPGTAPAPGRPRQIMLRRAVSTAYYAMFHALCQSNADALVGVSPRGDGVALWTRAYRALEHRQAKDRLAPYISNGNPEIRNFASLFRNLQDQRHDADYNPRRVFIRFQVSVLIDRAEAATQAFSRMPVAQRRALAVHLLLARSRS